MIDGKIYSPKNYNDKYAEKDVSMVYALAVSDNIYALKTHLFLGTNVLYETLKDFGITSQLNNNPSDSLFLPTGLSPPFACLLSAVTLSNKFEAHKTFPQVHSFWEI